MGENPCAVDVRVLGSLRVEVDGHPANLGGPRLRALLAALVAAAGRPVPVSALVRLLWDGDAPDDADRTVRTYMSRLRKALLPASLIVTRQPGYLLRVDPEGVDAARFERLAAAGRRELDAGRPDVAAGQLTAALGLWQGEAYEEFAGMAGLDAEARRLAELRHNAVQDRIDAELATGHGQDLIAELTALTTDHPTNERLWGQLMTALYRAGRQADALDVFRRARLVLVDRSGVEPSPALAAVHRRILAHDTGLLTPAADPLRAALAAGDEALQIDGDLLAGRRQFEIAHGLAAQAGDATAMARAALGLSGLWVHEHRPATGKAQLHARLAQALVAVDPQSSEALRLRVRLTGENDYQAAEHAGILALLDDTRRAEDRIVHAEALSIAHHCVLGPDHVALRQALSWELIGESDRTRRRGDRLMGLLWHTVDQFLAGNPHAERLLDELEQELAGRDHLAVGFAASAMRVMLTIRAGRFDEAEEQAKACAELGQVAGDADAIGWYGAQLMAIRWFQGRLPELLPLLDELVSSSTLSTNDNSYFAALAVAAATAGDQRKAAGSLARLVGHDLARLSRSSTWLVSMSGIAETAYLLDDAATAGRVHDLLAPYGHLPAMASLAVACFGSTSRALGVAAMAMGDLDRAVGHLNSAVQHNLALGHWPAVVMSRTRHAQALAARGGPGDDAAAAQELATAARDAAALGMPAPDLP
ncbi:BTAD domain-containing putative transcriptional regulator [Kutzneria sp. NPDC052558]|uniref:AfsR/SARP family transcriptional regulator n=1 Tax=Kutzneria sp. NPDC052558 TaxID=3364121 RepID=UPI0037CC3B99